MSKKRKNEVEVEVKKFKYEPPEKYKLDPIFLSVFEKTSKMSMDSIKSKSFELTLKTKKKSKEEILMEYTYFYYYLKIIPIDLKLYILSFVQVTFDVNLWLRFDYFRNFEQTREQRQCQNIITTLFGYFPEDSSRKKYFIFENINVMKYINELAIILDQNQNNQEKLKSCYNFLNFLSLHHNRFTFNFFNDFYWKNLPEKVHEIILKWKPNEVAFFLERSKIEKLSQMNTRNLQKMTLDVNDDLKIKNDLSEMFQNVKELTISFYIVQNPDSILKNMFLKSKLEKISIGMSNTCIHQCLEFLQQKMPLKKLHVLNTIFGMDLLQEILKLDTEELSICLFTDVTEKIKFHSSVKRLILKFEDDSFDNFMDQITNLNNIRYIKVFEMKKSSLEKLFTICQAQSHPITVETKLPKEKEYPNIIFKKFLKI